MHFKHLMAAGLAGAFLTGCAAQDGGGDMTAASNAPGTRLVGDDIQVALVDGQPWQFEAGTTTGYVIYMPDSTAQMEWRRQGQVRQDNGTWRMDGDVMCASWDTLRDGQERCFAIYRTADGRYAATDPQTGQSRTMLYR